MKKSFVAVTIASLGTIFVSISAQTPSPAPDVSAGEEGIADENTDRRERCDCPSSPDGKFAFLTSDAEKDSFEDRLQIIDLIEKKSGKKLQRIDDAAMPVLWNAFWAPDWNGFALRTKVVGHPRLQGVDVYFRSGETFQKIELPNLPDDNIAKEVVWAPDSKRFAFNYMVYSPRTDYETVAFYQLRGDKWVALRSPVDDTSQLAQLVQLAKERLSKSAYPRHAKPLRDILQVREWSDANTAILYANSAWEESGSREPEAAFLFTLKFDEAGNWKIVKTHQMSDKEIQKEDAGEVPGPARTTDQEKLSADGSFRDADRHLNEVYNALRARLSTSESDTLKKEQLAWINGRNAAAQVAKENAQENPTEAADREVTKMTLARVAELEKRLKKAK